MALTNNISLLLLILLSGFFDAKVRRIPNKITFPAILFGLIMGLITGGWTGLLQSFISLLVGLGIFFIPFALGGMGAGDVKLMGAIGSLMGWHFSILTALYSALIGGGMVVVYILYTHKLKYSFMRIAYVFIHLLMNSIMKNGYNERLYDVHEKLEETNHEYKKIYIPYGVAIAGGAIWVLIVNQGLQFLS
jgi:prepilin peptidase CpaA